MIKELTNYLRKKENKNKIYLLIGILAFLSFYYKDVPINTASVFGLYSGFFTFGVVLLVLGGLLTFIPGCQIPGIIAIIVGFLTAGGSIWAFFESLPSPGGIPIWAFLMIGIILIVIFRRRIARRTY